MICCTVVGSVTSTAKHPALIGHKLLLCRPQDGGSVLVAVDTVQAGAGDRVLVSDEGNAARLILGDATAPVRTVVIALVDAGC